VGGAKARAGCGQARSGSGTAPLKPKTGLNGPPAAGGSVYGRIRQGTFLRFIRRKRNRLKFADNFKWRLEEPDYKARVTAKFSPLERNPLRSRLCLILYFSSKKEILCRMPGSHSCIPHSCTEKASDALT
jgi:hypothetical protein